MVVCYILRPRTNMESEMKKCDNMAFVVPYTVQEGGDYSWRIFVIFVVVTFMSLSAELLASHSPLGLNFTELTACKS
jgi:hypothetical protein